MYCPDCEIRIPYHKAPELMDCTHCGKPFRPEVKDILEFGLYNIAKEIRPTQIQLGTDIEIALEADSPQVFLAEGGTGIGKSFAYLIPALLMQDKRVIVSTAKKTLQHQLVDKDVPLLRDKMGKDFEVCLYMGANNYACWKMIKEVPIPDRPRFKQFVDAARNANVSADLSRWEGPKPIWWDSISVKNCISKRGCPHYDFCKPHPNKARVVIVNHHLLAIDILKGAGSLLSPYDILVIDEAHQAPEAFRSTYSTHLRRKAGDRLYHNLKNNSDLRSLITHGTTGILQSDDILEQFRILNKQIRLLCDNAQNRASRKTGIVNGRELQGPLDTIREKANHLAMMLVKGKKEAHQKHLSGDFSGGSIVQEDKVPFLLSKMERLAYTLTNICAFTEDMGEFDSVYITEKELDRTEEVHAGCDKKNVICTVDDNGLSLRPVDIGKITGPSLLPIPKKIILSATLALNKDFSYIKNELGLNEVGAEVPIITEKIYPTPFDLRKQARLYIPRDMLLPEKPDSPLRPKWIQTLTNEIVRLIKMVNGDTFVLFSARKDMEEVHATIQQGQLLAPLQHPVLVQNEDGDATQVQRQYLNTDHCTLFGLKSFWEGIDIPGDKLRLVIIPKLPFPVPTDPIINSLSKAAGDKFFDKVFIPRMLFDLKQAAGRLIRTKKDYGIVAVLDPRVWSGSGGSNQQTHYRYMETLKYAPPKMRKPRWYGKTIIASLGFPLYQDSFTKLQTFVNNHLTTVNKP